jgi:hypothetical protein
LLCYNVSFLKDSAILKLLYLQYTETVILIAARRSNKFRTITKVLSDLHGYTNAMECGDYLEARATLETHLAHKLPDQGVAVFNRQISKYRVELLTG